MNESSIFSCAKQSESKKVCMGVLPSLEEVP
jgi:hypothetical protein